MSTDKAVSLKREALLRLLVGLFAAAGIVAGGAPVATLSKPVRLSILRVLLPLESALRRLIFFRMKRMAAASDDAVEKDKSKTDRKRRKASGSEKKTSRAPVFWLFDKLKWFAELSDPHRRPPRGPGPQISFLDDRDVSRQPVAEKAKRDPDDALRLCRRLQAAMRALRDIDGHARRLKRIIEARRADPRPRQTCPMRPGPAPGYRRERTLDVDDLLYQCHSMANERVPPEVS